MFDLKLKFRRYPYIIAWVSFRLSKWDITFIRCGDLGRARHRHRRMRQNQSGAKHGHCAAYSHHRKPLIALDLHARRWSSHPFGHRITMKVFLCYRPTGAWELHTKSNKKKKNGAIEQYTAARRTLEEKIVEKIVTTLSRTRCGRWRSCQWRLPLGALHYALLLLLLLCNFIIITIIRLVGRPAAHNFRCRESNRSETYKWRWKMKDAKERAQETIDDRLKWMNEKKK